MKVAAIMLRNSKVSAYVLSVPVAKILDFRNKMESQRQGIIIVHADVHEAFEAPSDQNGDIKLDTNSIFGKACHKHKGGQYEPGRAKETFQEEFSPANNQEGDEYECDRSGESGEACHQNGCGHYSRAKEIFQEVFGKAYNSLYSIKIGRVLFDMNLDAKELISRAHEAKLAKKD